MGQSGTLLAFVGANKGGLRAAIRRDAELTLEYAAKVRAELEQVEARMQRNLRQLDAGVAAGDLCTMGADAVDDACSRLARRIDHMTAMVEVAYANEGG
jgi:hypothetical protein